MRHLLLIVLLAVVLGCSKKTPPAPDGGDPGPGDQGSGKGQPKDSTARDRAYWLSAIKSSNQKTKSEAVDELAAWVETDAETIAALVELLKDRTNAGLGRTHPMQITSIREAAARALLGAGPKGEAALKDKGFAALREGLNDKDAGVREHTAYAIGILGPIARPLSPDVMKLCTAEEAPVRGMAFDALRQIGITDPVGFAKLLTNDHREVIRLAAELAPSLQNVPAEAVPHLAAALDDDVETVRTAAAAALATAGPKAAPAAGALIEAIKKTYPAEFDPMDTFEPGSDAAYWRALAAIGEPAVTPTAGLLTHGHPIVRAYAAQTLGDIGAPSKSAVDKLKTALNDTYGIVSIEAACALCRIGEAKDDAVALVKRAIDAPNDAAQYAIEAIPRMGEAGKPLIPQAIGKLGSRNAYARFAAVGLVGSLPPAEAAKSAEAVGKLATDDESQIRFRVGTVLEKLGPAGAGAADSLGKALPKEEDQGVRDQFIAALLAMGAGAKPALPALLPLVGDQSTTLEQRIRVIAAVAVADPASPEVSAALLGATKDGEQAVRVAAAGAIARLDPMPQEALTKLVAMANSDKGTHARFAALRALAAAGPKAKPVRADVEKIATGRLPEFAILAKVALAAIDGDVKKAAGDIRAALGDKNAMVRGAAAESLLLVGPTAADIPALLRLLRDRGMNAKESAAKCVARLGPVAKDAVPLIIKLLDDTEGDVRAAAAEALGEMGPAALPAVEKLKELRGTRTESDPQAGPAARKALEKLGVKEKR